MLPLDPTPVTRRRLLLIRSLYRTALLQAGAALAHRRILAIITFDLANETMLKLISDGDSGSQKGEDNFHDLVSEAAERLRSISGGAIADVPGRTGIKEVHSWRNRAQHDGSPPSSETVDEARHHTREFLWAAASGI